MKKILFAIFLWTALGLTGAFGQKSILAENQQLGVPPVLEEASLLLTKSSQLASAGLRAEAVQAAQAAVGVLRDVSPPEGQTAYLWLLTQALDTWTVRLIEAGRLDEAAKAAHETVQVSRQAATAPGADVSSIASLLMALSPQLTSAGLHSEAAEVAQAAADVPQEESRKAWGATMSQNSSTQKRMLQLRIS